MTIAKGRPRAQGQFSDHAASHVRALIMSGQLASGENVRPETIAEQLDISSTPSREALQLLRAEGFLELAPGRGFSVAPLTGDDVRDLFVTQSLIAGELAARAAIQGTADDIHELQALHHELIASAARNDTPGLESKNHEFHRQINLMARSRKMTWSLSVITRYVPREFYGSILGWPDATVDDHGSIFAGIRDRDPDRARSAMASHIIHAGDLLASHVDNRPSRHATAGEGDHG